MKMLIVAAAIALGAQAAAAASYTFNVSVTESMDSPSQGFDLPGLGTLGSLTFVLDAATLDADGDPSTGVDIDPFGLPQSLADASVAIGGLSSSLDAVNVFSFPGGARFTNGSFASIDVALAGANCAALGCTFAGSFSISGPAGAPTPATFADVATLLADPGSRATFSFNGTIQSGDFISFRASSVVAPVPLPATAPLLAAAILGGAALRRRRAR